MAPSFDAYPSVAMVGQDDFASSDRIDEIFGRAIRRHGPDPLPAVDCAATIAVAGGGVRLTFTSSVGGLTGPATLSHRCYFVDRNETRERVHLVGPDAPDATTELLILFPEETDRDYCHVSVFDAQNRLLAVHAIVFDRAGRLVQYPFTDRYVSPLELDRAELTETRDPAGRRVLRFTVALKNLAGPERVALAWEAIGLTHRRELVCDPGHPVVSDDLSLDDNAELAPGDWVVIAVDEKDRVLAQTLVHLVPARAAGRPWPA